MTCFRDQVHGLAGKRVRLGRGGPDERKGTLVGVYDDFMAVFCDDGCLVYYPLHHLKSMTELINSDTSNTEPLELPEEYNSIRPTFTEMMKTFTGKKVQVYDHGPESATGFVFEVGDDYAKLVTSPDEMVHYPFFHIRSVRLWKAKAKDENKGGKDGKDGKRDDKASVKTAAVETVCEVAEEAKGSTLTRSEQFSLYFPKSEEKSDRKKKRS
ncbi:MAG TPA: hypothetical protein VNT01_04635 [Symbiobacteriaceae bacterium]|nr:hypothetical protein [Symbiobacteriaceae bacterium]